MERPGFAAKKVKRRGQERVSAGSERVSIENVAEGSLQTTGERKGLALRPQHSLASKLRHSHSEETEPYEAIDYRPPVRERCFSCVFPDEQVNHGKKE